MKLQRHFLLSAILFCRICGIAFTIPTNKNVKLIGFCSNFRFKRNFTKRNLLKGNLVLSPNKLLYWQRKHISVVIKKGSCILYNVCYAIRFKKKVYDLKASYIGKYKMQSVDVSTQPMEVQKGKRKRKVAQKAENNQEGENGKLKGPSVHVKTKKAKVNGEGITTEKKVKTAKENQVLKNNGINEKKKNDKSKISPVKNNTTKKNEKGKRKSLKTNAKQQETAKEETKGGKKEKIVEKKEEDKKEAKKEVKKEVKKEGKKVEKAEKEKNENVQEPEKYMQNEELVEKEEQGTTRKKKTQGENNVKPKPKANGKRKNKQQETLKVDTKKKNLSSDLTENWEDYEKIRSLAKKTNVYVGAHISAQGGVKNAPINSFKVAGMAFAVFLKNQRTWVPTKLTEDNITDFGENCKTYKYDNNFIVPHAPYLINLASADVALREKSYESFIEDLKRCEVLNIKFYNIHPGSTTGNCSIEEGIQHIAECINRAHQETKNTIILLENEAGRANCVGSKFEQLRDIINQIVDKERIGVCLDTCHAFAAGYDIRTAEGFENTMEEFDKIINLKYLKAVHLNDSKGDLGCCKDRHENIGKGKLTIDTFKFIMNSKYFKNMPIILETPDDSNDSSVYKREIAYMYSLAEL